uniref:Uncharacterized protein n=1 Tax=Rhizophora mucronata TaxID=61149 RepID=A0A2P2PT60_RHIMU
MEEAHYTGMRQRFISMWAPIYIFVIFVIGDVPSFLLLELILLLLSFLSFGGKTNVFDLSNCVFS